MSATPSFVAEADEADGLEVEDRVLGSDESVSFMLLGDGHEVSTQVVFLRSGGHIKDGMFLDTDEPPTFYGTERQLIAVLGAMWQQRQRFLGWWLYRDEFIRRNICTGDAFGLALRSFRED